MIMSKFLIKSLQYASSKDLITRESGAEYDVLRALAETILLGGAVTPIFQKKVNAIIAKAVLNGALPKKRMGRPKLDSIGLKIAAMYFELMDQGTGYSESVAQVATAFHKDESHIMRLVKANKSKLGETPEERVEKRQYFAHCSSIRQERADRGERSVDQRIADLLSSKPNEPLLYLDSIIYGDNLQ